MKKSKERASAEETYERLRGVIIADKGGMLPKFMIEVLQHDLLKLLSSYFDLLSLTADLNYDKEGRLWLNVESRVARIKQFEAAEEAKT